MKLKARFPQIMLGDRRAAGEPSELVQRSALGPTTRGHDALEPEAPAHPLGTPEPPRPQPALRERSRSTWLSTVAAWRSTTGLNGRDRT